MIDNCRSWICMSTNGKFHRIKIDWRKVAKNRKSALELRISALIFFITYLFKLVDIWDQIHQSFTKKKMYANISEDQRKRSGHRVKGENFFTEDVFVLMKNLPLFKYIYKYRIFTYVFMNGIMYCLHISIIFCCNLPQCCIFLSSTVPFCICFYFPMYVLHFERASLLCDVKTLAKGKYYNVYFRTMDFITM